MNCWSIQVDLHNWNHFYSNRNRNEFLIIFVADDASSSYFFRLLPLLRLVFFFSLEDYQIRKLDGNANPMTSTWHIGTIETQQPYAYGIHTFMDDTHGEKTSKKKIYFVQNEINSSNISSRFELIIDIPQFIFSCSVNLTRAKLRFNPLQHFFFLSSFSTTSYLTVF